MSIFGKLIVHISVKQPARWTCPKCACRWITELVKYLDELLRLFRSS